MANVVNKQEHGGKRWVIGSGGSFDVASGGEIDVESGGSLKLDGTAITSTAAELNILDTVTSTAAELNILDGVTADKDEINLLDTATAGTVVASKAVIVDASKDIDQIGVDVLSLTGQAGARSQGTLMGAGTDASPATSASADHAIELRYESTATSGTSRAEYIRLYSAGAGQDNDAVRFFHTCEAALTGAHGQHCSLNFGASGSASGLATALRTTLHVPDSALTGGNYAALQGEVYMDGNSSDISGVTKSSILRLVVSGGDATARNTIKNALYLSCESGSGKMVQVATGAPGNQTGSIRIDVNGTTRYLMFWDAQAST